MQDSREKKQCLIFVRNNANDTADRIEAYAKKSGMEVVETKFIRKVGNPYMMRVGKMKVKVSFANNGVSIEEAFKNMLFTV